jgi:hypothetical protein
MDEFAEAMEVAMTDLPESTPVRLSITELNPENAGERYGTEGMLSQDDYGLVFGTHGVKVQQSRARDTGHESEALREDYRFVARFATSEWSALELWGHFSSQDLVRTNILFAQPQEPLDKKRTIVNGLIALPVIQGDPEKTKLLMTALSMTYRDIERLADHPAMEAVLEKHKDIEIGRQMDKTIPEVGSNQPPELMRKYAIARALAEGAQSNAQTLAYIAADSPKATDMVSLARTAWQHNWFDQIARGIPAGITNPFAVRGIVPQGGLLEPDATKLQLRSSFEESLGDTVRTRTREMDFTLAGAAALALGETVTGPLTDRQHQALEELSTLASQSAWLEGTGHIPDTGCPATTHGKKQEGLISLTTRLLIANLERANRHPMLIAE